MTSHNEDKGHWHGDIEDGKMHFELPDATSTSHNEAQKTNEEIVEETFDEYVNYWSGSPKGKTHRVGLTKQELAFVLTLKDEAHRKELEEIRKVATTRTRKLKIGQNEYARNQLGLTEKQIDDHNDFCNAWEEGYNYAKDEILKALTPTKEVTEELTD